MEHGVVTHFNASTGKRFGFIRTAQEEELFFHLNDGREIAFKDGPFFLESTQLPGHPKKDDILFFSRDEGRMGEKASPWGFEYQFRQAKRKVGLKLLSACLDLADRFSCLPIIFAEAKRPGDSEPFTVSAKPMTADILNRTGRDHYPSGNRVLYYALAKSEENKWQYKLLSYSRFCTWRPDGVGVDYQYANYIGHQLQSLGNPWVKPAAVLEIDTTRSNNIMNVGNTPSTSWQSAEEGGIYHHTATLYIA